MPALDGIRFMAALSVAVFHLIAVAAHGPGVYVWGRPSREVFGWAFLAASYGWVGVPLFFMVSGFVICMTSWGRTVGDYAVSRFVRLFPAFWAWAAMTTAVAALHPYVFRPLHFRDLLANLTMMQDPLGVPRVDDVYWTLWLELKFYLLFLVVVRLGLSYQRVVAFCIAWGLASVWAGELNQRWLTAILMPGQSQYFIAGIALYLVHRYGGHLVPWLIVGFSWLLAMHFYDGNPTQRGEGLSYTPASVLVTLCYGVMILLALGRLNRLRWSGLTVLGTTTYPLYLLHYVIGFTAIHYLYPRLGIPPAVLLVLVLIALTGLAWLVHRLIERPIAPRLKAALLRPL
jgi:peptidoglycan/LPS O-acetylase OafA/YrhL